MTKVLTDIFQNILERLEGGEVIIGDGSYTNTLEKRGYVKAGHYTPESSVEHPGAVEQLAEEFARAGADITQTFTFYNRDVGTPAGCNLTVRNKSFFIQNMILFL